MLFAKSAEMIIRGTILLVAMTERPDYKIMFFIFQVMSASLSCILDKEKKENSWLSFFKYNCL